MSHHKIPQFTDGMAGIPLRSNRYVVFALETLTLSAHRSPLAPAVISEVISESGDEPQKAGRGC